MLLASPFGNTRAPSESCKATSGSTITGRVRSPSRSRDVAEHHRPGNFDFRAIQSQMEMRAQQRWILRQPDVQLIRDGVSLALLRFAQPVRLRERLIRGNGHSQRGNVRFIERKRTSVRQSAAAFAMPSTSTDSTSTGSFSRLSAVALIFSAPPGTRRICRPSRPATIPNTRRWLRPARAASNPPPAGAMSAISFLASSSAGTVFSGCSTSNLRAASARIWPIGATAGHAVPA